LKKHSAPDFDPASLLLGWFGHHRRDLPWRRCRGIYAVWVSEVMLQQTKVATVVPYFRRFLKRFPTLRRLAAAPLAEVLKAWEGLGYYSRARNLWRAACWLAENSHGRIPTDYREFRKLPGVGDYTAAAVLSIACRLAVPVVDGNVLRVACRLWGIDQDIRLTATRKLVASRLEAFIPPTAPGVFNEALMELGALVCMPKNPCCRQCPLQPRCQAHGHGLTAVLPVKSKRMRPPLYQVALAVIVRGGKFFVQQRPEVGHLGGLWEFPGGKCRAAEKPEKAVLRECREELGVEVAVSAKLAEVPHAYTHFKIVLHVFVCRLRGGSLRTRQPHAWIRFADLAHYPFPAANHKFFPKLKEYLIK